MLNEARGPHDSFDVERPKEFEVALLSLCRVVVNRGPAPPSFYSSAIYRYEALRICTSLRMASQAPLLGVNYLTFRKCDDEGSVKLTLPPGTL